jgi:hypothetical protein
MAMGREASPGTAGEVAIAHVLCAVDLSTAAAKALRYAAGLRAALDAQLAVVLVRPRAAGSESSELTAFIAATIGSAAGIVGVSSGVGSRLPHGGTVGEQAGGGVRVGVDAVQPSCAALHAPAIWGADDLDTHRLS